MKHMHPPPVLLTARLVLRPFRPDDAPDVRRLAGDVRVADTTSLIPHPYPEGAAERWIATHEPEFERGRGLVYAVTLAAARHENERPDALVGAMGLVIEPLHRRAELGYWIGVPFWGRGYATEAAERITRFALESLLLHRVEAVHFVRNPASGRVMRKIGMSHEGRLRGYMLKNGVFEDVDLYARVAGDSR